jgi:hypothetical protein
MLNKIERPPNDSTATVKVIAAVLRFFRIGVREYPVLDIDPYIDGVHTYVNGNLPWRHPRIPARHGSDIRNNYEKCEPVMPEGTVFGYQRIRNNYEKCEPKIKEPPPQDKPSIPAPTVKQLSGASEALLVAEGKWRLWTHMGLLALSVCDEAKELIAALDEARKEHDD